MRPGTFASLVSALLYEKRFGPYFCEPIMAGLNDDGSPFICSTDLIGANQLAKDFVVSGTASESVYGACESLYKPDLVTKYVVMLVHDPGPSYHQDIVGRHGLRGRN